MAAIAFDPTTLQAALEMRTSPVFDDDEECRLNRPPSLSGSSEYCISSDECTSDDDPAISVDISHLHATLVAEMGESLFEVQQEEVDARICLTGDIESLQRVEIARLERCARDVLYRGRALYFRHYLTTAAHRGYGPAVWPRHQYLPPAAFNPVAEYRPDVPVRSCLRRGPGSRSSCSSDSGTTRRVLITDCVDVQAGPELVETDGELASAQWRSISLYAPVRHMVMMSLKGRFGADASDEHGWMSTVESFAWLDEIFCSVKDAYQQLHNEEAAEWASIMDQHRSARLASNVWWTRLNNLVWY